METPSNLANLHSEHANWQEHISRFKQDLKDLDGKLGNILSKFTPREVPPVAEHFQNQFILQKEVLDIMRHDFKQYENLIENEQKKSEIASAELVQMRNAYLTRLEDYKRILNDLKSEFATFEKEEIISA